MACANCTIRFPDDLLPYLQLDVWFPEIPAVALDRLFRSLTATDLYAFLDWAYALPACPVVSVRGEALLPIEAAKAIRAMPELLQPPAALVILLVCAVTRFGRNTIGLLAEDTPQFRVSEELAVAFFDVRLLAAAYAAYVKQGEQSARVRVFVDGGGVKIARPRAKSPSGTLAVSLRPVIDGMVRARLWPSLTTDETDAIARLLLRLYAEFEGKVPSDTLAWTTRSLPPERTEEVEERAAIMEVEGGLPRDRAERAAIALGLEGGRQ